MLKILNSNMFAYYYSIYKITETFMEKKVVKIWCYYI